MASESQILHDILLRWGSHPRLRLSRQNVGRAKMKGQWVRFGVPGTADIVGILAPTGRMVMLECKTATGRQREDQRAMERVILAMGGVYAVVRSVADADAVLGPLVNAPRSSDQG